MQTKTAFRLSAISLLLGTVVACGGGGGSSSTSSSTLSGKVIDGYIIAQLELEHKRLPFIIRRPIPNGGSELWKLQDLEIIC